MKKELIQLKRKDLKPLREEYHTDQDNICPILKQEFDVGDMVVDHLHMTKKETIGENDAGLIRGCIHRQVNSFEGKVVNSFKRYGMNKFGMSLPNLLRNLADYLELEASEYIHPNEAPKKPKLMKSSYNKLKKVYNQKRKFPAYPKSGITKALQGIYDMYDITPEFYKV